MSFSPSFPQKHKTLELNENVDLNSRVRVTIRDYNKSSVLCGLSRNVSHKMNTFKTDIFGVVLTFLTEKCRNNRSSHEKGITLCSTGFISLPLHFGTVIMILLLLFVLFSPQISLQSLESFLCLFHYVQHHPTLSSKDALRFW